VNYTQSLLEGHVPSKVLEDGSQVFTDIPFSVRQPDGTMRTQMMTVTVKPVPAVPVLDESIEREGRQK
jgi:hypothetical protein